MRRLLAVLIPTALLLALSAQAASAATLKADYRFNGTLASSVGTAPDMTDIGAGNAFAMETVDGSSRRVRTFPQGNGLQATVAGVISTTDYSVAGLFRLAEITGFRRIAAGSDTEDQGVYVHDGKLAFRSGGVVVESAAAPITAGGYHQVVFTRSGNTLKGFVDGALHLTIPNDGGAGNLPSPLRFAKDNTSGLNPNEESAGAMARIRLYDGALTDAEVAALDRNPPLNKCDSPTAVVGTGGDDVIDGTPNKDIICGLGGDDTIDGNGGDDVIYGGEGDDNLTGGDNDTGNPGTNKDTLFGEAGNDDVDGGLGNDVIDGGAGGDGADGGIAAAVATGGLNGGDGHDAIYGRGADDTIHGDAGNDLIYGNDGADNISGGDDNDRILGGATGDPTLSGGEGNDAIFGEDGADRLAGDAGNDSLLPRAGDSEDVVEGGDGTDRASYDDASIDVYASIGGDAVSGADPDGPGGADGSAEGDNISSDIENVSTGRGNDTLIGDGDSNRLDGNDGNDDITGNGGPDILIGRVGNDTLRSRFDATKDIDFCGDGTDHASHDDGLDVTHNCETFDVS